MTQHRGLEMPNLIVEKNFGSLHLSEFHNNSELIDTELFSDQRVQNSMRILNQACMAREGQIVLGLRYVDPYPQELWNEYIKSYITVAQEKGWEIVYL